MVMKLGLWLKMCYLKYKRQGWDFCEEFMACRFATNCAAVKFVKAPMSSCTSYVLRDLSYVDSAICSECPRKDWRGKSFWIHPQESGAKVDQGPGGEITSPTSLGPVLVLESAKLLEIAQHREVFRILLRLLPCDPPLQKTGCDNEWTNVQATPYLCESNNKPFFTYYLRKSKSSLDLQVERYLHKRYIFVIMITLTVVSSKIAADGYSGQSESKIAIKIQRFSKN